MILNDWEKDCTSLVWCSLAWQNWQKKVSATGFVQAGVRVIWRFLVSIKDFELIKKPMT